MGTGGSGASAGCGAAALSPVVRLRVGGRGGRRGGQALAVERAGEGPPAPGRASKLNHRQHEAPGRARRAHRQRAELEGGGERECAVRPPRPGERRDERGEHHREAGAAREEVGLLDGAEVDGHGRRAAERAHLDEGRPRRRERRGEHQGEGGDHRAGPARERIDRGSGGHRRRAYRAEAVDVTRPEEHFGPRVACFLRLHAGSSAGGRTHRASPRRRRAHASSPPRVCTQWRAAAANARCFESSAAMRIACVVPPPGDGVRP